MSRPPASMGGHGRTACLLLDHDGVRVVGPWELVVPVAAHSATRGGIFTATGSAVWR
jgi:hypothetical protein